MTTIKEKEEDRQIPPLATGFAGGDFFYSNLHIQEVLTAVRYGIEARKGLIIVTGAPGVGKTTVLRKLSADLPGHITGVEVIDPRIGFADLLRAIVGQLHAAVEEPPEEIAASGEEESALVRRCQALLRARLERCEIVALLIDNAQLLPDRTLRNLLQNFLGGSAEAPDGALLQVILVGGRALRAKLAQAALVPMRRRRPMICELHRLSSAEIGSFIEQGLLAGDRPPDLFDERAVKRIALLTDGNPRAVHTLCARALQAGGTITPELIETLARDLPRSDAGSIDDRSFAAFGDDGDDADRTSEKSFEFASSRSETAAPAFFTGEKKRLWSDWLPRGERLTSWVKGATIVVLLLAAAAMIPAQSVLDLLAIPAQQVSHLAASWGEKMKPAAPPEPAPAPPPPTPEAAEAVPGPSEAELRKIPEAETLVPLPGPDRPAAPLEPPAAREPNPATKPPSPATLKAPRAQSGAKLSPDAAPRQNAPRPGSKEIPARDLQSEIVKAIASRAIEGVEVSVVRSTAILDGHVATERQRRAAERAARSVNGVERVHNRIAIIYG